MDNNPSYDPSSLETDPLSAPGDYTITSPAPRPTPTDGKLPSRRTLLFIGLAVIVLIGLVIGGTMLLTKKPAPVKQPAAAPVTINTQSLDNGVLTQLTNQAAPNETKQQLTVAPDTLFKKNVEINGTFTTDSTATVGNSLNVGGNQNVKGSSTLQGAVGINSNLAVRGALSVGGALSAGSLSVGNLVVTTVTASGALNFGGHLVPSGATPASVASVGAGGGSVVIEGNDTSGTIIITTGSGAQLAGEMAITTFKTKFATTPRVQLTALNGSAADLHFYASRSAGFFTINSTTTPTASSTYAFDYFVSQ